MKTREEKIACKNRWKRYCEEVIQRRMAIAREAMADAQDAANGEDKSSAGDKYETARARSHREKEMHARQLMAHTRQWSALLAVNTNTIYDRPVPGAFIQCDKIAFFIAAGLGKQSIGQVDLVFISPQSPLARQLAEKRTGDEIDFNGKTTIVDIF